MSKPGYIPGDPWVICDLSGKQIRMSQSRKTWDGLRVDPEYWYPKHPQLMIRAIPDHMAVVDGRPRSAAVFVVPSFGYGSFCLISPNGTLFTVGVFDDPLGGDGVLMVVQTGFGHPVRYLDVSGWRFTVDNDGALHVNAVAQIGIPTWQMASPQETLYEIVIDIDGAVHLVRQ